jgi:predicted ribosome quality control (RQC) complex YloA/Tae2 family protein
VSLRPTELRQVAEALSPALAGAAVQKVWAPWPQRLELELRQPGLTVRLRLSVEPAVGRVSIIEERTPSAPGTKPSPWLLRLRKELVGRRLTGITASGGQELVLRFEKGVSVRSLVAELGTAGALLLLGDQGVPLAAAEGRPRAPRAFSPFPEAATRSRLPPAEGLEMGRAVEALLAPRELSQRREALQRARLQPLRLKHQRLLRTRAKVQAEASRDATAQEHRRLGELLQRNLESIPRGASSVRLTEWTEEGPRQVDVPLDPATPPRAQMERHFHQYRRLARGSARARQRLAELDLELGEVLRALAEAEQALPDDLIVPGQPAPAPTPSRRRRPAEHRPYRIYRSADGHPIWVGRAGADNDALTFHIARPHHVWLHARGVPGAHVVVPLERRQELPQELLLDAAHLALHHARSAGEPRGEVAWTRARLVRRVKGGAPGQVTYSGERVLAIRIEPERLARLQRTREEES